MGEKKTRNGRASMVTVEALHCRPAHHLYFVGESLFSHAHGFSAWVSA
jgi:hypothetical protein